MQKIFNTQITYKNKKHTNTPPIKNNKHKHEISMSYGKERTRTFIIGFGDQGFTY